MSQHVGRDRTRRVRGKSRFREAFEETLSESVSQVLEGHPHSQRIITEHNRAIQDLNSEVAVINRRTHEETSDLEKDETKIETERTKAREDVKNEQESITRRVNLLDAQAESESRSIHLLAQRGGRIIAHDATLPVHEQKGTEVIETEVETRARRLLEIRQQKAELEERKHRLERDLALELRKQDEQLAGIKERKRRLTADKEQRLAAKETEKIRVIEDTQQRLKENR